MPVTADPPARPLVVGAEGDVLDELLRLAATAGVELDVAEDGASARGRWTAAPLVVVVVGAARSCLRARLARRPGVLLLGEGVTDDSAWRTAVELGAEHVVLLPEGQDWLVGALADAAEAGHGHGRLVAVVGGRGGAGATTLSAALAVTAARGGRMVLLVDGDPLGGGIDLVLGGEDDGGVRWPDLGLARGRVPAAALARALPRMAGLSVLSWDRGAPAVLGDALPADAMAAVVDAGLRAHELVVVDLPRSFDEATRVVLARADLTLLIVPAEVRAAASAAKVAAGAGLLARDLRLVVRGPSPSGLDGPAVARALGLPLAGDLRAEPGLDLALERGEPPARHGRGPLSQFCGRVLTDLLPARAAA